MLACIPACRNPSLIVLLKFLAAISKSKYCDLNPPRGIFDKAICIFDGKTYSSASIVSLKALELRGKPFNVTTVADAQPAQIPCAETGTTSEVATGDIIVGNINSTTVGIFDVLMDQICNNSTFAGNVTLTNEDQFALLSQVGAAYANASYPWWLISLETCTVEMKAAPAIYGGELVACSCGSATGILDSQWNVVEDSEEVVEIPQENTCPDTTKVTSAAGERGGR